MSEEEQPPVFKNVLYVDVDSEREETVQIGKPKHFIAPLNKNAMEQVLMTDLTTLCEGIVTVAHLIDKEEFHSKDNVIKFVIQHLAKSISETKCVDVKKEEATEETETTEG